MLKRILAWVICFFTGSKAVHIELEREQEADVIQFDERAYNKKLRDERKYEQDIKVAMLFLEATGDYKERSKLREQERERRRKRAGIQAMSMKDWKDNNKEYDKLRLIMREAT